MVTEVLYSENMVEGNWSHRTINLDEFNRQQSRDWAGQDKSTNLTDKRLQL